MLRLLFRLIVLGVVSVVRISLFYVYQWGGANAEGGRGTDASAEAGTGEVEGGGSRTLGGIFNQRIRDTGAEIAQGVATSAELALAEARLTAKITSKMALDDSIEVRRLNVDTNGTVVTVRGSVDTRAQRERALQLARETDGVTSVVDRIDVAGH
jgi:osmotically-inducible protein OsmY